jgi:hypothetical protein
MRFLSIVKAAERKAPPTEQEMEQIGQLMAEGFKAGWLLSAEGLMPTEFGFRVRSSGGKITVTDGPFTEAKEIVGGFSIFTAASKEEAIALARKFAAAGGGDAETEVRQLYDMPGA